MKHIVPLTRLNTHDRVYVFPAPPIVLSFLCLLWAPSRPRAAWAAHGDLKVWNAGPAEADLARRAADAISAALRRVGHGGLQDEAGGALDAAGRRARAIANIHKGQLRCEVGPRPSVISNHIVVDVYQKRPLSSKRCLPAMVRCTDTIPVQLLSYGPCPQLNDSVSLVQQHGPEI